LAVPGNKVISMKPSDDRMRLAFLGWQCRLRQLAVRELGARPSAGMQPGLTVAGQDLGRITMLITPIDPLPSTLEFRHIVRRTHDPQERYKTALRYLQASFFQDPKAFDDGLTALFSIESELPAALNGRDDCGLAFEQFNQRYSLTSTAVCLEKDDTAYQATYWHNALFNAGLPAEVAVIRFRPDWTTATADPSPL